jgi:hypothetical protein
VVDAAIARNGDWNAGGLQLLGIELAFIAQRVVFDRDNERRR